MEAEYFQKIWKERETVEQLKKEAASVEEETIGRKSVKELIVGVREMAELLEGVLKKQREHDVILRKTESRLVALVRTQPAVAGVPEPGTGIKTLAPGNPTPPIIVTPPLPETAPESFRQVETKTPGATAKSKSGDHDRHPRETRPKIKLPFEGGPTGKTEQSWSSTALDDDFTPDDLGEQYASDMLAELMPSQEEEVDDEREEYEESASKSADNGHSKPLASPEVTMTSALRNEFMSTFPTTGSAAAANPLAKPNATTTTSATTTKKSNFSIRHDVSRK
jgi:hypothetical protein